MIELLSPAGGADSVTAAVRCGANAVYLGLPDFNARRNAENFSAEQLKQSVEYCHIRGVRVFLTLNTLVRTCEMPQALAAAKTAADFGADALIVQDIGLAALLRRELPDLPLHASTQLSVHSYKAVEKLSKMGFARVVAAREMSKSELRELISAAHAHNMEVEVFVHGALCMSLSGQCRLSGALGSRSGNRGLCAGPCRLPFSVKGGTGCDLSLKDLCLLDRVSDLREIGADSLKIEGRMKRPEYVAAATAAYRRALDGEPVTPEMRRLLADIFSRGGFTSGYFDGKTGRDMFGRRTDEQAKMSPAAAKGLHELYRRERCSVSVSAHLSTDKNTSVLTLSDGVNTVKAFDEYPTDCGSSEPNIDAVREKIARLGSTPFKLGKLTVDLPAGTAVPSGQLNRMRRAAAEKLCAERALHPVLYPISVGSAPQAEHHGAVAFLAAKCGKKPLLAKFRSVDQMPKDLSGVDGVILPIEEITEETAENIGGKLPLYADLPRGMSGGEESIKKMLQAAAANGVKAAFCGNIASLQLCAEAGIPAIADFGMNIINTGALAAAADMGFSAAVLSPETPSTDIAAFGSCFAGERAAQKIPLGAYLYGRSALMLLRNCPNKNSGGCADCGGHSEICDRKGIAFPLLCRGGYTELFNSRPLYVADRAAEFTSADFFILTFTTETADEAADVIAAAVAHNPPTGEYTREYRTRL